MSYISMHKTPPLGGHALTLLAICRNQVAVFGVDDDEWGQRVAAGAYAQVLYTYTYTAAGPARVAVHGDM